MGKSAFKSLFFFWLYSWIGLQSWLWYGLLSPLFPQLAAIKLARYGEDLLFYLYYMNGGDLLQLLAAVELWVILACCSFLQWKLPLSEILRLSHLNTSRLPPLWCHPCSFNRDWRYHKEERVWITRAPGMEPSLKTNTYERGTYYFFDCHNWRKVAKVRIWICLRCCILRQYKEKNPNPNRTNSNAVVSPSWLKISGIWKKNIMYSYILQPIVFNLCVQEFHLEYDKLEERPHVPTTFNYNPAQQAF